MRIPIDRLDPETLRRVIEEFVSREGTDYGFKESDLLSKVAQVERLLRRGDAILCFDANSESCHIISRETYQKEYSDEQLPQF